MEFKTNRKQFLDAISWTQSVVERKTTMPVLSNALLEAKNGKVHVTATDLEVGVITQADANVIQEGKFCVLAKSLYDLIKEFPSEEIHIKKKDQNRLEISSEKSQFKIAGLPPEEFPNLPAIDEKNSYSLPANGLKEMLDKTSFAISSDESRYNLHGVYLEKVNENGLRMVATDGHRLSYVERELSQKVELEKGVIVPKKGVYELKRLVGSSDSIEQDNDDLVNLVIDGRNLIAKRRGVTLVSRLVDGDFPDYQAVIPKKQDKYLVVDKDSLIGALRRVSVLVSDKTRGIKFSLSNGILELSASNPDLGEAREELSADYKGERLNIGFNARYFLDVLAVLKDEKVIIEINGESGPSVIRSEFDRGFLSVIMPMRI